LRSAIHQSGRTFDANAFHMIGIEAEVAFRIGRTFTPGPRPQREEIESAMGEAFPAIEVVDARIRDFRSASGPIASC
jgi:2-keto-4-pentenoate hydratase